MMARKYYQAQNRTTLVAVRWEVPSLEGIRGRVPESVPDPLPLNVGVTYTQSRKHNHLPNFRYLPRYTTMMLTHTLGSSSE
jgi:hypothetical protein